MNQKSLSAQAQNMFDAYKKDVKKRIFTSFLRASAISFRWKAKSGGVYGFYYCRADWLRGLSLSDLRTF